MDQPFQMTDADSEILKDDGNYRVYDISVNPFNSGRTSYFHNALGGYHAAKPGRIQEIDDFYLSQGDIGVLNMMNVKYIIATNQEGKPMVQQNPYANGSAWFVENVLLAENANDEMRLLDSLDTKTTAVIHKDFLAYIPTNNIVRDSTATLDLASHTPQHIVYETSTKSEQLAIFSEVYYPKGWNAYINGNPAEYFRADYVLRAMKIPPGNNKIEFKFEPKVIQTGSSISLASSVLFVLVFFGGLFYIFRKEKTLTKS